MALDLHGLGWSTPIRKAVTAATVFCTLVASAGGAVKAWPEVEPYVFAHRGYARNSAHEQFAQLAPLVNQLMIGQAQDSCSKITSEIAGWNIKLPSEQDPETRAMISRQIAKLNADREKLNERIRSLGGAELCR